MRYVAVLAASMICSILLNCGFFTKHKEKDVSTTPKSQELSEMYTEALKQYAIDADPLSQWPDIVDCDATLWAGEAAAAGTAVQLNLAEYPEGVLNRRPFHACWTPKNGDQGSKSSISRDQFSGYLWGLWVTHNLAAAQRLADYGQANNWVMGGPSERFYEVDLGTNLTGLLCRMIAKLSNGADKRECAKLPIVFLPVGADYEHHTQVLDVLLLGEIESGLMGAALDINGNALDRLKEAVDSDRNDALFSAALGVYSGDYDRAINLLSSKDYAYPSYVRGSEMYKQVHWLFASYIVLKHHKD